jgi:hypothetical protein
MKNILLFLIVLVTSLRADDTALIRQLLEEKLDHRTFAFADVVKASTGKFIIPLDETNAAHQRITAAIRQALPIALTTLSQADSPVRKLRRINEASHYFENILLEKINQTPGLRCEVPPNKNGDLQRSGYPDLKITDTATGLVAYLDPKLVEQTSIASTLRTFYYEPKANTGKINDNAIHLLCGIEHDGREGEWTFTKFHLVDLSTLRVRLKAEFQASNAELYHKK